MNHTDAEKQSFDQIERASIKQPVDDILDVDRHLEVEVPPQLKGLSEGDLDAVHRSATRKIDIMLLPILIVLYVLNFLDRQNISSAKIGGMTKDLHLTDTQFSTCVAILFAGYISLQIPSNIIASRVSKPGVYICAWTAAWGAVSACTGAVQSYEGLVVCRLILGFTEAAFFPGALFLLSLFYTKKQLALRTAILYSGSQLGNAFGGLFALAILQADGVHGIQGWRWLFIIEGAMTVGFATLFAIIIPNRPTSCRWLSIEERASVLYNLERDRGTKDATSEISTWQAFKLVVIDPKVWLLCATLTSAWVAASVTNFFPVVVAGLGMNRTTSLAITAPPYIFAIFVITLVGWHSDKLNSRAYHVAIPLLFNVVANIIALTTTKIAPRYVAMMMMPASCYSAGIVILSWVSSSVVGPDIKRAIALALINAISNTPNIWTSYLYHAPRFILAFSVNLGAAALVVVLALVTRMYLRRLNRKLENDEDLGVTGPTQVQRDAGFRFTI